MRFCSHCGKEIDENAAFCPNCGSKTNGQPAAQSPNATQKRLHCPRCKSTRLSAMTESVGSISGARGVGKRSAIGASTTLRERSWTCHDCGYIFRNADDLAAEYARKFTLLNTVVIICAVFWFLISLVIAFSTGDFGGFVKVILAYIALGVGYYFMMKKGKEIHAKKVEELRSACFD